MISWRGSNPCSTSTARSFLGRSLIWPSDALTTYSLPRYLLMVFALAGDSTITRAFGIRRLQQRFIDISEATTLSRNSFREAAGQGPAFPVRKVRRSARKPSYLLESESDRPNVWQYPLAGRQAACDPLRVEHPLGGMPDRRLGMHWRSRAGGFAPARLTDGGSPREVPRLRPSCPGQAWRPGLSTGEGPNSRWM